MEENPNNPMGGEGCLCSETKVAQAKGPYVVFNATETDCIASPYPVICASCLIPAYAKLMGEEVTGEVEDDVPDV